MRPGRDPAVRRRGSAAPGGAAARPPRLGSVVVKAQVRGGQARQVGRLRRGDTPNRPPKPPGDPGHGPSGHPSKPAGRAADRYRARTLRAVIPDAGRKGPLVPVSAEGGIDIEEVADPIPARCAAPSTFATGFDAASALPCSPLLAWAPPGTGPAVVLARLYGLYAETDAELVEINPLALTSGGRLISARLQARARRCLGRAPARVGRAGRARAADPLEAQALEHGLTTSSFQATSACSRTAPG